jgi:hypothetical protein
MATIPIETPTSSANSTADKNKTKTCEELAVAIETGRVGDIVAKHEKLILQYYEDVQKQATDSFKAARTVAYIGFGVLIMTWLYTLGLDVFSNLPIFGGVPPDHKSAVKVGVISATLIEFIASINFWLYSKASKQFGAFHICLERTHRYLVAYKIGEETGSRKEAVLAKLACIMASAPMITNQGNDSTRPQATPLNADG